MGYQNFFATKLATEIGASDTTITLDTPPTVTSGRLVLEARNATQREIIEFTGVSGSDITGVTRGVGGTEAKTHIKGSLVEMNVTAEDLEEALGVPEDVDTRTDEIIGDHVASGLIWTDDTGLTADMSAGVAYINGIRLDVDAVANHTFSASVDTYIDLGDNGVLDYNEESNGAAAPAIAADHIRLAKVSTDGSDITGITLYRNPAYLEKADGWNKLNSTLSVSTGYNKGNKSFVLSSSVDLTDVLTPGMRLKLERSVKAPTQCADLEASSSQYASKSSPTGITFTDDFTCEAWIKLESYGTGGIVSRFNGSSGFLMNVDANGRVRLYGQLSSGNARDHTSYQSLPLGRWVHVAASLNLSGGSGASDSRIFFDGVQVPSAYTAVGTATQITQAGDLQVGAYNGSQPFDGKIADVRVWSTIRTATEIRDNMNQQLVGNETNLVAYFKLDGNFNDSTANANHLTGSGGAAATDTDNPFSDTEYGIVTDVSSTEVTVFTGTDHGIPNQTLLLPAYSTQSAPFGFPRERDKWELIVLDSTSTSLSQNTSFMQISVPVGSWDLEFTAVVDSIANTVHSARIGVGLSTSSSSITELDSIASAAQATTTGGTSNSLRASLTNSKLMTFSSQTTVFLVCGFFANTSTLYPTYGISYIRATCAYL